MFATGEVDVLTAGRLRAAVNKALREAENRPVVVDLTAITFLGSHGLAALADAASTAQQRRDPLRVVVDETRGYSPVADNRAGRGTVTLLFGRGGVASVSNLPQERALLGNNATTM